MKFPTAFCLAAALFATACKKEEAPDTSPTPDAAETGTAPEAATDDAPATGEASATGEAPASGARGATEVAADESALPQERKAAEIILTVKRLAEALVTTTDLETAGQASETISALCERVRGIQADLAAMTPLEGAEREAVAKRIDAWDEEIQEQLGLAISYHMETLPPDVVEVLEQALAEFFLTVEQADAEFVRHFGEA